jgi:hypothetical protein
MPVWQPIDRFVDDREELLGTRTIASLDGDTLHDSSEIARQRWRSFLAYPGLDSCANRVTNLASSIC